MYMKRIKALLYSLMGAALMTACTAPSAQTSTTAASSDAEVIERVIMARRSIRQYTDRTLSRDTLQQILLCGINAPNGQNRQAYELRVVDNPQLLQEISDAVASDTEVRMRRGASTIFAGAPCVVFIARETTYDISAIDCGLLGENLILKAWSMGIGSCCMAGPTRQMMQSKACTPYLERLGFSPDYELLYCITLGYPAESPEAKPRKYEEKIRFVE